ncbi:MAG: hypothetical protein J7647_04850 [Cyanobacteria bacterium SBLK]|nr:hypothetical protein [Cyanobacteria bacterium SBLK]
MQNVNDPNNMNRNSQMQSMHKYILILSGIFLVFVATFVTAFWRVAESEKFDGLPFKTLPPEAGQKIVP